MNEVSEVLSAAWLAVDEAEVPQELQAIAFQEAVRLLAPSAASAPDTRQRQDAPDRRESARTEDDDDGPSEGTIYDRIVAQTGVDREKLERVTHLDDDGPRVTLPGLKLGKNTAERARAVAQILTIVRGFGLEESDTSLEVIRAECERLKVYDSANFSAHMRALSGFVVTGTGQNRKVRAKGPGIQSFPGLVDTVLGKES